MWNMIKEHKYKYLVLLAIWGLIAGVIYKVYKRPICDLVIAKGSGFLPLKYLYMVSALMVVGLFGVLIWLLRSKPIEKITLFMILLFGLVYVWLIPPYAVPDEASHINTSYYYSNIMLGRQATDENGYLISYIQDQKFSFLDRSPSAQTYSKLLNNAMRFRGEGEPVVTDSMPLSVPPTSYLPQLIGMTLARILCLGEIQMLLWGRIFALLFFSVCVYWSIKLTPLGKDVFMVAALFPVTLQMACSYSYDVTVISLCFLFTALLLHLTFDVDEIRKKHWVALIIIFAWLSPIKVVYFLLAATLLIIPKEKFKKPSHKYIFVAVMLLVGGICVLATRLSSVVFVASEGAWEEKKTYTLAYLLEHPKETVNIGISTTLIMSYYYIETMMCQKMGCLEINVPPILVLAYFSLLVLSCIKNTKEKKVFKPAQRFWVFFVISVTTFCIGLALCLDWTPLHSIVVEGIQGRYFTPMLPLLFVLFKNKQIEMKDTMTKYMATAIYLLQVITICSVIKDIASR